MTSPGLRERTAGDVSMVRRAAGVGLPTALLLAGLAANLFSGHAVQLGWPIAPDRVLIGAALVLAMTTPGAWQGSSRGLTVAMGTFVLWIVFSMASHGDLLNATAAFALLDRVVLPFALFLVAPTLFRTDVKRDALLLVLTAIGLYLGVSAVLEFAAPQLVWPSYVTDPAIGLGYGRARGPFVSPEGMGAAVAMCGVAAAALAVRSPRLRELAVAVAVLDLAAVVLSLTRAVWAATLVAFVVVCLRSPEVRRYLARIVAVAAAAVAVIAAVPAFRNGLTDRANQSDSVYDRLGSNDAAVRLLGDLPLTGIGWRRFYPHGADWVRQSDDYPLNNVIIEVHNVVLSRAAELGLPAAILFVAIMCFGPLLAGLRKDDRLSTPWRTTALAVFVLWLVAGFFGPMATPFPNYVAWLIAGVAATSWVRAADQDESAAPRSRSEVS